MEPRAEEKTIVARYEEILARIRDAAALAGRRPEDVRLLAVSKKQPFAAIVALYRAGHRDFGENYVQELLEKAEAARAAGLSGIRWHFIGHLQSNKVKALLPSTHAIHAVDTAKLAREISKRAEALGRDAKIYLAVNIDGEASKSGLAPDEALAALEEIARLPRIKVVGWMCIPDPERDPQEAFRRLADLRARDGGRTDGRLSMGMTSDFEEAIAAGSTDVRVGTAIFGERG